MFTANFMLSPYQKVTTLSITNERDPNVRFHESYFVGHTINIFPHVVLYIQIKC